MRSTDGTLARGAPASEAIAVFRLRTWDKRAGKSARATESCGWLGHLQFITCDGRLEAGFTNWAAAGAKLPVKSATGRREAFSALEFAV
jgi:hypothetical protein